MLDMRMLLYSLLACCSFTIINACKVKNDNYKDLGLNSDVAVVFNVEDKTAVITGEHPTA